MRGADASAGIPGDSPRPLTKGARARRARVHCHATQRPVAQHLQVHLLLVLGQGREEKSSERGASQGHRGYTERLVAKDHFTHGIARRCDHHARLAAFDEAAHDSIARWLDLFAHLSLYHRFPAIRQHACLVLEIPPLITRGRFFDLS